MKICVLQPSYEGSASPFAGHDPECDPSRFAPEHSWTRLSVRKATAGAQIRSAAPGVDLFFNLCDGAWDEDRPGIDVVRILEQLELPYTGADSRFYEPTREAMKRVCRYFDIATPAWAFASSVAEAAEAADSLRFPLIVKHPASYASIGMTRDSRVSDRRALMAEAGRFISAYGGVLIEEFIDGREFTVLVCENAEGGEPHTFAPVECRFPAGESFKHFDLKWVDYAQIAWLPVEEVELARQLRDMTARMFAGLGGSGYGRADLRADADGRLFMLEMNPQPGVFYPDGEYGSADIILANDAGGHRRFVQRVISAAIARQQRSRRAFLIQDNGTGGYGMFAARDVAEGEIIDAWEGRPQRLVSRRHAETWNGQMREWFSRYAWPIGEDVFAIWADDPMDWRPIDHACEPNAWLHGLDLVARRPIARGESITCDYGTFCGELMAPFACNCGASECRGMIQGSDHLLERMDVYGDHVSPWVAARRRALAWSRAEGNDAPALAN
jgi:D-alanine-D-alanine ligase-like ATP-grasp enzyme